MIQSMTGYGDAECFVEGVHYAVEVRSLNHRYYKASIKLPEPLQYLEPDIDRLLRDRLARGSVGFSLRIRSTTGLEAYEVNIAALERYIRQLEPLKAQGVTVSLELGSVFAIPGLCEPARLSEEERARQWEIVRDLAERAVEKLLQMRRAEGEALRRELLSHCQVIRDNLEQIRQRADQVVREYHQRLLQRAGELAGQAGLLVDSDALAREVALFAERSDITEEIARLYSHLQQFQATCDSPEPAGRKLEFLAQEMLREANTIAAKSSDVQIARAVIEIKASIDRLKEQAANIA